MEAHPQLRWDGAPLVFAALLVPVARFCGAADVRGPPGAEILPPSNQSSLDLEPGEAQCATCAGDKPGPSVKCSFILSMVFFSLAFSTEVQASRGSGDHVRLSQSSF